MGRFLIPLLEMMRLRSGPQDLPANRWFTLFLVAMYIAGGISAETVLEDANGAERTLVGIGIQFAIIVALLRLKGFLARAEQTIAALSGTGFLIGLIVIYLLSLIDPENPQTGLAALFLLLFFWSLAIDGHIYRCALSSKMGTGVLVAVTVYTVNFILLRAVFG